MLKLFSFRKPGILLGLPDLILTKIHPGEIRINPYEYMRFCFEKYYLNSKSLQSDSLKPLALQTKSSKMLLTENIVYSILPRMFTAWDHYHKGVIASGTWLKSICLLPYLRELQVDIIYLLPIFEYSNKYKKGELGSPYAIKNIYKLDLNLHDDLLGSNATQMIEIEFKAFVEACHILGIKVMVDFVFRTVSRDNDLIYQHPEWFYWIDIQNNKTFSPPTIRSKKSHISLNDKTRRSLYRSPQIKQYLSSFSYPPSQLAPVRWNKLLTENEAKSSNILDDIEETFKVTTAPGFSDVINDTQPPWTDVTYLKFYNDPDQKVLKYLDKEQTPYILQDGASLNLYHGKQANQELWEYVAGVIPFYQTQYGIDGARIDMGHALPAELNQTIVTRAKKDNPNFILWSEEFSVAKSQAAQKDGFHFISGFTWAIYKELEKPNFNKIILYDTVLKSALPITAALETPDTPRLAYAYRDKKRIEQLVVINSFLPNAVVFLNNGLEVMELQPMNLGLDNTEAGRFVLEKNDPVYGKLAFFDNYNIHWLNADRDWMSQLLKNILSLRQKYTDLITNQDSFHCLSRLSNNQSYFFMSYFVPETNQGIFILANRDFNRTASLKFSALFSQRIKKQNNAIQIEFTNDESHHSGKELQLNDSNRFELAPGGVIIGSISKI